MSKNIKNIFGWLEEITLKKSPPSTFTQKDWDTWNSYMIHRFLSMNIDYIDVVNYVQKINPQEKEQIYTIYRELIPQKKVWLRYIKSKRKSPPKELIDAISEYYNCSKEEAQFYIEVLPKEETKSILKEMGWEDKEMKKLFNG